MKSAAYWKQRFEDLDKSLLSMGDQYYYDEVEKQFRLATREIEKEISIWYKRLEAERFAWPSPEAGEPPCVLTMKEPEWLLEGFDLWAARPHKTLQYQSVT